MNSKKIWIKIFILIVVTIQGLSGSPQVVKVGAVSMEATHAFNTPLVTKINAIVPLVDEAGTLGLDIIVFPESYFRGTSLTGDYQDLNNSVVLDSMKSFAAKNKINIAFQVVEKDGLNFYNTVVVVNRNGNNVGKYRKVNLPPEEQSLTPGDSFPVFDLDFGKVGILICWDFWFTNPVKNLVDQGAELIIIPTWCNIKRNLWTNNADSGVPIAFSVLRVNCGSGEEDLQSSVFDHLGDQISVDHMVGQNKIAIGSVVLGGFHNLARNKPVKTSSGTAAGHPGSLAVDGQYSIERGAPTENQTGWQASGLPQWIEIDLGQDYRISRISIAQFNSDEYEYRLEGKAEADTSYRLLCDQLSKYETFLEHGITGSEVLTARLDSVSGCVARGKVRYIRLTIDSATKDTIVINEIKVFGYADSGPASLGRTGLNIIPEQFKILSNYPNPFNPETTIRFLIAKNSKVKLTVYYHRMPLISFTLI